MADDPVAAEMSRLGVRLSLPSTNVAMPEGQALTREQQTEIKQRRGRAVRTALEAVTRSRTYQRLPDVQKIGVLERAIRRARTPESSRLRRELPRRAAGGGQP